MLMAFFQARGMEIQLAKRRESLAVSRWDLVARPRAAEPSQRAKPTHRVAFRAAQALA